MEPLDVLVVENRLGAGRHDVAALKAAGHRVHSCHDEHASGFPCRVIAGTGTCPVDDGVDVALSIRRGVSPRPTDLEAGISCVLRAGVPLIEAGPDALDPYQPFIEERITGHAAEACEHAVEERVARLRDRIRAQVRMLLDPEGVDPGSVDLVLDRRGRRLHLTLVGPELPATLRHTLGVRALDAVRAEGFTGYTCDVAYRVADTRVV